MVSRYFQCHFLKFTMCLKHFCIDFWCSFLFISRKSVQRRTRRFWAEIAEVTTYGPHDAPSWLWRSVGGQPLWEYNGWRKLGHSDQVWDYKSSRRTIIATTVRPSHSSRLTENSPSTQLQKILSVVEQSPSMDSRAWNGPSHLSIEGNWELIKETTEICANMEWRKPQQSITKVVE